MLSAMGMCVVQEYCVFDWLVVECCVSGGGDTPSFGLCNPPTVAWWMSGWSRWVQVCGGGNHNKLFLYPQNTEIGHCPIAFFTVTYSAAECSEANWLSCPGGRCKLVVDEV